MFYTGSSWCTSTACCALKMLDAALKRCFPSNPITLTGLSLTFPQQFLCIGPSQSGHSPLSPLSVRKEKTQKNEPQTLQPVDYPLDTAR